MSVDNIHKSGNGFGQESSKSSPGSQSKSLVPVFQSKGVSKTNVIKTTEDAISKQFSIVSKSLDLRYEKVSFLATFSSLMSLN